MEPMLCFSTQILQGFGTAIRIYFLHWPTFYGSYYFYSYKSMAQNPIQDIWISIFELTFTLRYKRGRWLYFGNNCKIEVTSDVFLAFLNSGVWWNCVIVPKMAALEFVISEKNHSVVSRIAKKTQKRFLIRWWLINFHSKLEVLVYLWFLGTIYK